MSVSGDLAASAASGHLEWWALLDRSCGVSWLRSSGGWFLLLSLDPDDEVIRRSTQLSFDWASRSMSSRGSRRRRTVPCLLFEDWSVLARCFFLVREWEELQTYW